MPSRVRAEPLAAQAGWQAALQALPLVAAKLLRALRALLPPAAGFTPSSKGQRPKKPDPPKRSADPFYVPSPPPSQPTTPASPCQLLAAHGCLTPDSDRGPARCL